MLQVKDGVKSENGCDSEWKHVGGLCAPLRYARVIGNISTGVQQRCAPQRYLLLLADLLPQLLEVSGGSH